MNSACGYAPGSLSDSASKEATYLSVRAATLGALRSLMSTVSTIRFRVGAFSRATTDRVAATCTKCRQDQANLWISMCESHPLKRRAANRKPHARAKATGRLYVRYNQWASDPEMRFCFGFASLPWFDHSDSGRGHSPLRGRSFPSTALRHNARILTPIRFRIAYGKIEDK